MDIRLGSSAASAPIRNRPLRVGIDYGYPMPVLHRGNCNTNGERALTTATLLRSQYDSLHNASRLKANGAQQNVAGSIFDSGQGGRIGNAPISCFSAWSLGVMSCAAAVVCSAMSAFGGKADIGWRCRDVRF